jgi:L-alanine-DL-glutamate epimerase-like enolase superfamily enzyme
MLRIESIELYEIEITLPIPWVWSAGSISSLSSSIVRLRCEGGLDGWGEACPFGSFYVNGFHGAIRNGLRELAPALIGQPLTGIDVINARMDAALFGHNYIKSAVDIACWDALGKHTGLPVCELLGGRFEGKSRTVTGILLDEPDALLRSIESERAKGCTAFSIKASGTAERNLAFLRPLANDIHPGEDFYVDANRAMLPAEALRMLRALPTADFLYEQPCRTYEETLLVRRQVSHPIMMDEVLTCEEDLLRAVCDRACDAINIKIGRVGGLTRARRFRDICLTAGLKMSVQDTAGTSLAGATVAHMAQSIPIQNRLSVWDVQDIDPPQTFQTDVRRSRGALEAGEAPGLGVTPNRDVLGRAVEIFT